jgi:hypothetical protein
MHTNYTAITESVPTVPTDPLLIHHFLERVISLIAIGFLVSPKQPWN